MESTQASQAKVFRRGTIEGTATRSRPQAQQSCPPLRETVREGTVKARADTTPTTVATDDERDGSPRLERSVRCTGSCKEGVPTTATPTKRTKRPSVTTRTATQTVTAFQNGVSAIVGGTTGSGG